MEMLKIVWTYLIDVGGEVVPKKRYALALGFVAGLSLGWAIFG